MKIKVAIIGCGSITEFRHAPEYKANLDVEIVAFCDPIPERAERLAKIYGGRVFSDYRDVLGIPDLEAVSVCTSNSTHAVITIDALNSGMHVLCEKPMATSLEDAKAMIRAAEANGKYLMIGHNQRLADAHVKAKKVLRSGELGRILSFKTTFGHSGPEAWSADKGTQTWFFSKNTAFLGAMGDLGIHKADLIRWLLDEEIDEVLAAVSTMDKRNNRGELIEVEDNAVCILKCGSGITGSLTASWTYYGEEDNSSVIYCEGGVLRIYDNLEYPLIVEMKNGEKQYFKQGKIQTNTSQVKSGVIDAFINSVKTDMKPEISGEEGFEALSIVLACMESACSKEFTKVVHLPGGITWNSSMSIA